MREIKFRLWDHEDSIMITWDQIKARGFYVSTLVTWPHLCQYTGLKDKNGKEIYEGDILKSGKVFNQESPYIVEYEDFLYWMREAYLREEYNIQRLEVIGNIFENPELLNIKIS